jgi:hypothetical protein
LEARVTQLFDQMTVPDPPAPRPAPPSPPLRVDLHLDRVFNTPESNALDLSRFSSSRTARRHHERPRRGTWFRNRLPGVGLVVSGALLGVAIARL